MATGLNLIGGGLANVLLALRLKDVGIEFQLHEASPQVLGEHTWSFHESDLNPEDLKWVEPLVSFSWSGYTVRFPGFERRFSSRYFTIRSEKARDHVMRRLPPEYIKLKSAPQQINTQALVATGFPSLLPRRAGWQKFVGWDIVFNQPHGLREPVIMDATVEQIDGYRFIYLLPFNETTLLIEDTRYSNGPDIDMECFRRALTRYIGQKWPNLSWEIQRQEQASLPIPLDVPGEPGKFGVAGGFFHPVTGYSLPHAMRNATAIASLVKLGVPSDEIWARLKTNNFYRQKYYVWLNRMMFLAATPEQRWRIFARFYGLREDLIARFYAGESTFGDCVRILIGRPPVPIWRAMKALFSKSKGVSWN